MKDLESKGNSLIKHCISDDGTVIRGKLDELKYIIYINKLLVYIC